MKLHRFYVENVHDKAGQLELDRIVWIHDAGLLNQWLKVLRFKSGDNLILFNDQEERLYRIKKIESTQSILLEMVTDIKRKVPKKHVYLFWAVLKNDKNDFVIQKATELGVSDLVPIITNRCDKTGINIERARKIIIEAAEQCGRGDLPIIREPINLDTVFEEYTDLPLYLCEQVENSKYKGVFKENKLGILVGPEGGWSDNEKAIFKDKDLPHINLSDMTLRAETAAIAALTIAMAS